MVKAQRVRIGRLWGRQDASLEIGLGWCFKDPMEVQVLRTQMDSMDSHSLYLKLKQT